MYHVYLVIHYKLLCVGWLSSDRELDSLLSATPFNIIYFIVLLFLFYLYFDVNKYYLT